MWMKAWVYSPLLGMPLSSSLYLDLSDRQGQVIASGKYALFDNMSSASFGIPSTLAADMYVLRAYTAWSAQCGQVFTKPIYIFNRSAGNTALAPLQQLPDCRFYPESGKLIENVQNTVAFRISGFPPDYKIGYAEIVNQDGRVQGRVSAFNGDRGLFTVVPRHGQTLFLRLKISDSLVQRFPLPASVKTGLVLHVENSGADKKFILTRNPQDTIRYDSLLLTGTLHHQEVLRTYLNLEDRQDLAGLIPSVALPEGLLQLNLFDRNKQLLATRPVFLRREEAVETIIKDVRIASRDAGYQLSLELPDTVCGSVSVLVRKLGEPVMQLPGSSLMQGLLADPYRVKYTGAGTFTDYQGKEGDINVMTEEWPGRLLNCTSPDADTAWIRIRGKIDYPAEKIKNMPEEMTLVVETRDSTTTVVSVPVSSTGSFEMAGLYFEDSATFNYQFNAKKPLQKSLPVKIEAMPSPVIQALTAAELGVLFEQTAAIRTQIRAQSSWLGAVYSYVDPGNEKAIVLEEVKLKVKKLTPEQEVNKKYTSGVFSSMGLARTIDLENNYDAGGALNVFEYLKGRIPGLRIGKYNSGEYYIESTKSYSTLDVLQGGNGLVDGLIFVNEVETGSAIAANYSMNQIALIKYFPPGTLNALTGGSIACVLVIYTKNGPSKQEAPRSFMGNFKVKGFDVSPVFSRKTTSGAAAAKDMSRTLYWNPDLVLTGQQTIRLEFAGSAYPGELELILEGITCNGKIFEIRKRLGNTN